jgi:hypothetical protein
MTGDDQASDCFNIPSWVPPPVADAAKALRIHLGDRRDKLAVLDRIVSDDRMDVVWKELLKKKRGSSEFLYRAHVPSIESGDAVAHQHAALVALFYYAVSIAVSKPRVLTMGKLFCLLGRNRKAEFDKLAKAKNRLFIKRDTGDARARCFVVLFANRCEGLFRTPYKASGPQVTPPLPRAGKPMPRGMYRVTSRVASVALGQEISECAVREWCLSSRRIEAAVSGCGTLSPDSNKG